MAVPPTHAQTDDSATILCMRMRDAASVCGPVRLLIRAAREAEARGLMGRGRLGVLAAARPRPGCSTHTVVGRERAGTHHTMTGKITSLRDQHDAAAKRSLRRLCLGAGTVRRGCARWRGRGVAGRVLGGS